MFTVRTTCSNKHTVGMGNSSVIRVLPLLQEKYFHRRSVKGPEYYRLSCVCHSTYLGNTVQRSGSERKNSKSDTTSLRALTGKATPPGSRSLCCKGEKFLGSHCSRDCVRKPVRWLLPVFQLSST